MKVKRKKKKILVVIGATAIVAAMVFHTSMGLSTNAQSDVVLTNVQALAQSEGGNCNNYGPAEMHECGGIFDGRQKKVCMCNNTICCTETACF